MAIDLGALLDQLEEWLEAQVPDNIQDLPSRMLETVERVSNDIFDSLAMHGPPSISSISIPFPPFGGKEAPLPPPPPPPESFTSTACTRFSTGARKHPLLFSAGTAVAVTVGIGAVGLMTGVGPFAPYARQWRLRRKFGTRGIVEDGMLKEAIVILAPSPTPPLLVPLAATLLKAGYVVLLGVPQVKEAEAVERRLSGLAEKNALRVLIYDPEDSTTFPAFHRSLLATLTLRFPAPGTGKTSGYAAGDPYNPQPSQIPNIHAFVSLYPLNPSPPAQPGALPALPTLVAAGPNGRTPMLITLYSSTSVLTLPDGFASQLLTTNHGLLASNLSAASTTRTVSVYLGSINLPSLPAIITGDRALSRRELARQRLRDAASTPKATLSLIADLICGSVTSLYHSIQYSLGIGAASQDYSAFESRFLSILKSSCKTRYFVGQRSWFPTALRALPPSTLPSLMAILPPMPSETGPAPAAPPKIAKRSTSTSTSTSRSASSSDHEGAEDLVSSIHTSATNQSSADSSGLEGSWVGLDADGR